VPSLPIASTSWAGVAPGASISVALQPPRSVSVLSSDCQLSGAQKLLKTGPAWKRIIASPPLHGSCWPVNVFPVTTNRLVPSLATPPCPQMPPQMEFVAHAMTLEGLLIGIQITHLRYVPQSPACPVMVHKRSHFTIALSTSSL